VKKRFPSVALPQRILHLLIHQAIGLTSHVRVSKPGNLMTMLPSDYPGLLEHLKAQIRQARTRAALAVNRELIVLY
jgi:hypothetical protein